MSLDSSVLLDAANAAKEVATLAALVLIKTSGDAEEAVALLDELAPLVPPIEVNELDAASIARQAIRDALVLRGGVG